LLLLLLLLTLSLLFLLLVLLLILLLLVLLCVCVRVCVCVCVSSLKKRAGVLKTCFAVLHCESEGKRASSNPGRRCFSALQKSIGCGDGEGQGGGVSLLLLKTPAQPKGKLDLSKKCYSQNSLLGHQPCGICKHVECEYSPYTGEQCASILGSISTALKKSACGGIRTRAVSITFARTAKHVFKTPARFFKLGATNMAQWEIITTPQPANVVVAERISPENYFTGTS